MLLATLPAAAADLEPGSKAPGFALSDQNGKTHTLEDYRDQWVALYFYPKDDTPGCTTEAREFRDDIFEFRRKDCAVLGVSLDSEGPHKAFAEKHGLTFPLLADTEGAAADVYGIKTSVSSFDMAKRQSFLIDPQGNIVRHYTDVGPDSHSKEVLADLDELQSQ